LLSPNARWKNDENMAIEEGVRIHRDNDPGTTEESRARQPEG
jgi:hypothetical protein